jgi:apolipoprotein N-acyltransferase
LSLRDCASGFALGKLASLKKPRLHPEDRKRFGMALAAGLLLAFSFPQIGIAGLAWVAPGLMLGAAAGVEGKRAFRIGYVAGLAHFLASLYWLLNIPVNKIAPITGWLLLSAYLAVYPAAWVWLCWRLYPVRLADGHGVRETLGRFLEASWSQRTSWALACAALWVTWEMVQARLFSGFPWNFLGTSQYRMLPLIQIASCGGMYAVSFIVAWASVSLLCGMAMVLGRPENPRRWMGEIILPLAVTGIMAASGLQQLFGVAPPRPMLKVALVQPSIPQTMIWNPEDGAKRFLQLLALSETALTNKPDLLVWPEAGVPGVFRHSTNLYGSEVIFQSVIRLAQKHQVWIVLGADDEEPVADAPDDALFYNSSFLVSPAGEVAAIYHKRRLVIFGEYVPLANWLPFLRNFTGVTSDFTPGRGPVPFVLGDLGVKISTLICFEDIFPHYVREHVEDDTDFLLNLTNNGWFGESAAQWQHAASAAFRALENGLPLVRCANNGLTCVVDAQGRMQEVYFPGTRDIYGVGFKVAEVPRLGGEKRPATFYRRHGDWFGWSCVGLTLTALALTFLRHRRVSAGRLFA